MLANQTKHHLPSTHIQWQAIHDEVYYDIFFAYQKFIIISIVRVFVLFNFQTIIIIIIITPSK